MEIREAFRDLYIFCNEKLTVEQMELLNSKKYEYHTFHFITKNIDVVDQITTYFKNIIIHVPAKIYKKIRFLREAIYVVYFHNIEELIYDFIILEKTIRERPKLVFLVGNIKIYAFKILYDYRNDLYIFNFYTEYRDFAKEYIYHPRIISYLFFET